MLSNQKPSRFLSVKGSAFLTIALALLMSVTAFASGSSRFAFIDSATESFGSQNNAQAVEISGLKVMIPCTGSGDIRSVSLPTVVATPGPLAVPLIVDDLTNCAVISYDFNVDFDPTVLTPAGAPTTAGTLSSAMSVTPNTIYPGHYIVSGFQGTPLCTVPCAGGETLLILNFNVLNVPGNVSPLAFADYTDPSPAFHPGFVWNEGDPVPAPVNGSVTVPVGPTPTSTNTDTPTPSATNTATNTNTPTPSNTATETGTATNTSTPTPTPQCGQIDIDDVTTTTGATNVVVAVNASDTTSLVPQAFSADFHITYDNTVLGSAGGPFYGVSVPPTSPSETAGAGGTLLTVNRTISGSTTTLLISVYRPDGAPFAGAGPLVNITFPTVTGGPGTFTPVNFVGFTSPPVPSGFQYNEGFPTTCLQNGSVQILGTVAGNVFYDNDKFGAPFTRPVPGTTLTVAGGPPAVASAITDSFGNYTLSGFGSFTYVVTPSRSSASAPDTHGSSISAFDAAYTAQRVVDLVTFSAKQDFVANVTGTGQTSSLDASYMAKWAVLLSTAGTSTGDWRFAPTSRTYFAMGSFTAEDYAAYLMGDPSGNWCDPTGSAGPCNANGTVTTSPRGANGPTRATNVTAPKLTAPAGSTITVPVSVQAVQDKGIIAYQFDLRYDPTVIQPTANAVTLNGTVSGDMHVEFNATQPGVLRVAVYGISALSQAGTLLNFNFTAVGNALDTTPLTWENFMFNEGGIRMNLINGEIALTPAVPNTAAE